MNSGNINIKHEIDSIMISFDEFVRTFDSAITLLSQNFIVDDEKYHNDNVKLISDSINEIRTIKTNKIDKMLTNVK